MKRTVKHRDTELCLKLKETQFRLLLFKMCPGHPSANKIAKTSPSVDSFLRDCNVQEKDTICQRRRVIRKKNHCSVLLFPISVMFPPTQEGTVWDVSCYYGDNQPRSLV